MRRLLRLRAQLIHKLYPPVPQIRRVERRDKHGFAVVYPDGSPVLLTRHERRHR